MHSIECQYIARQCRGPAHTQKRDIRYLNIESIQMFVGFLYSFNILHHVIWWPHFSSPNILYDIRTFVFVATTRNLAMFVQAEIANIIISITTFAKRRRDTLNVMRKCIININERHVLNNNMQIHRIVFRCCGVAFARDQQNIWSTPEAQRSGCWKTCS